MRHSLLSRLVLLVGFLFLTGCDSGGPEAKPMAAAEPTSPKPAEMEADLVGRWLRPDGGYVLEIKKILPQGKVEAAYFNPNPIHVESAQITPEGETLTLKVVLRDQGYDGSTYQLVYDPERDVLAGTYFMAGTGESFQIFFVRIKPEDA